MVMQGPRRSSEQDKEKSDNQEYMSLVYPGKTMQVCVRMFRSLCRSILGCSVPWTAARRVETISSQPLAMDIIRSRSKLLLVLPCTLLSIVECCNHGVPMSVPYIKIHKQLIELERACAPLPRWSDSSEKFDLFCIAPMGN